MGAGVCSRAESAWVGNGNGKGRQRRKKVAGWGLGFRVWGLVRVVTGMAKAGKFVGKYQRDLGLYLG